MDSLVVTIIASGFSALAGGGIVSVLKLGPERRNLTVDASQKAVSLLVQTMDELEAELVKGQRRIAKLEDEVAAAGEANALLQVKLQDAKARAIELEGQLATEQARSARLESQLRARPAT